MKRALSILLLLILAYMAPWSNMKDIQYGNLVFETEYDGLIHVDKLWLYDNGVFKIDMLNLEANGTFHLKADTIFLDYYKFKGNDYRAFKIKSNFVDELTFKSNNWIKGSKNRFMGIITDKLSPTKVKAIFYKKT